MGSIILFYCTMVSTFTQIQSIIYSQGVHIVASSNKINRAFEYYCLLGSARSYAKVAERFMVTKQTVYRWAKEGSWQSKLEQREAEAKESKLRLLQSDLVFNSDDYRKIINKQIYAYVRYLNSDNIEIKTVKDLETLIKLGVYLDNIEQNKDKLLDNSDLSKETIDTVKLVHEAIRDIQEPVKPDDLNQLPEH